MAADAAMTERLHHDLVNAADELALALGVDRSTAMLVMGVVFERASQSLWFGPIAQTELRCAAALAASIAQLPEHASHNREEPAAP